MICNRFSSFGTLILAAFVLMVSIRGARSQERQGWRKSFPIDRAGLMDIGRNTYLVLEPGYRLHLRAGQETLTITVLDETKVIDGVRTRVVEERETRGGKLTEVSRNYLAVDKITNDVYYFGEDVDTYKNGKVTSHEGSWLVGVNGASIGLMMPANPEIGDKYYQEVSPGVAMDRAEIISLTEEIKCPAGSFKSCLHTRESSALENGSEDKWYAPHIGMVKDANYLLAKIEKGKR
jgi:hypothetical protein